MADKPEDLEEAAQADQLTPEEASRIIHSHRKVRYGNYPRPETKCMCVFTP